MTLRSITSRGLTLVTAILIVTCAAASAEGKTLFAATNGLDTATCGAAASPCRSVSQTIENAGPGDKIIVGPGRYGDLDGDGTFNPLLGEEKAEVGFGCYCMVKVDKPLDIESRDGAAATVLDGGTKNSAVVAISGSNVLLGKKKRGFTLTHGNLGVYISQGTSGVRVEGNLVIANGAPGFRVYGHGNVLSNNRIVANSIAGVELNEQGHVLIGNQIIAHMDGTGTAGLGIVLNGSGHQLSGNIVSGNADRGFDIGGTGGHHFSGNVASGNGTGFDVEFGDGDVFTGNLVNGNGGSGFLIEGGTGHVLTGNAIVGNKGVGVALAGATSAAITKNNIYGNADGAAFPATNCGIFNQSDLLSQAGTIDATNNYWGAPTGPGANPADAAGNLFCDFGQSDTTTRPPATKEFKLKLKTPTGPL
jgi:parallel beta-helix repeat protein